jgi:hypothetical protein
MAKDLSVIDDNLIRSKIVLIKNIPVILDRDVADIYGVETREINQAIKNNPKKFPSGCLIELTPRETNTLRSKILTLESGKGEHSKYGAKAFTEKALYMLATILKGDRATTMTLQIIDIFTKFREIQTMLVEANKSKNQKEQSSLLKKGGKLITELLRNELDIDSINTETSVELNLGFFKLSQKKTFFAKKK